MKFVNTGRCILSIGNATVHPYSVTRDYSPKEIAESNELAGLQSRGVLVEYKGVMPVPPAKTAAKSDPRYETEETFDEGKKVTKVVNGRPVTYVVADSEGVDGVSMMDDGMVTSLGKDVYKSPDFIETGVDAGKFKNGADAIEAELKKEFDESTVDDEDTLAEHESERSDPMDVEFAEAEDHALMVKKNGKMGAELTTAKAMIETDLTKGLNDVAREVSKNLDNGETVSSDKANVSEFLSQPFNAKKYMIAKETDAQLLTDIESTTQSESVKKLVSQRLAELKK
jgi:hypothetical protein